jgi:alpha-galactosidase
VAGSRAGLAFSAAFAVQRLVLDGSALTVEATDDTTRLRLTWRCSVTEQGLLHTSAALTNLADTPYEVAELAAVLPVPDLALELLDLAGRWAGERQPQRHPWPVGTWLREGRHGRTGADSPLVLVAGTPGFGFATGQVWGVHLAWSGDSRYWAQRLADGTSVLAAGELLTAGEVVLAPGETYVSPEVFAGWSDAGLDGLAERFHRYLRARPSHPTSPRPVVLNTWEAVYFDHDLGKLTRLADVAAAVGVERFVLDDGWFAGRVNDSSSLGDWYVDTVRWPDGLHPLVDHVHRLGMQFGLWVEPEMVSPDSALARAHPDWVLRAGTGPRLPVSWRQQQVLDLVNEDAFAYLYERLDALVSEYRIGYLKWDHNRDLVEAGHRGRPAVHEQTLAVYRLLDQLRARHPALEIESCSSGGSRVDLGILARTDRVWASDNNDALDRQAIQRWTQQLLPLELVGAHVGAPRAHVTGRTHDLSFRFATAVFGHFGLEWDLTAASTSDITALTEGIAWWKGVRELLHSGRAFRVDHPDPSAYVHGVVADGSAELVAVVGYAQLGSLALERPARLRVPGLAPARRYRISPVFPAGRPAVFGRTDAPWWTVGGATLTGRALATTGVALPVLGPAQAALFEVRPV